MVGVGIKPNNIKTRARKCNGQRQANIAQPEDGNFFNSCVCHSFQLSQGHPDICRKGASENGRECHPQTRICDPLAAIRTATPVLIAKLCVCP